MDTYSVVYSPAARDDLFGIYTYIATECRFVKHIGQGRRREPLWEQAQ